MRRTPGICVAVALLPVVVRAGAGEGLDPAFGEGGVVELAPGEDAIGGAVAALPDGGVVVGATAYQPSSLNLPGRRRILVARLRGDGTPDPQFGNGGFAFHVFEADVDPWQSALSALAVQPDGRIVLAGESADRVAGTYTVGVMRLLSDGSPDPSFGAGDGIVLIDSPSEQVAQVLVDPNGRILLGGMGAVDGKMRLVIRRLASDGSADPTFGVGGV